MDRPGYLRRITISSAREHSERCSNAHAKQSTNAADMARSNENRIIKILEKKKKNDAIQEKRRRDTWHMAYDFFFFFAFLHISASSTLLLDLDDAPWWVVVCNSGYK